MNIKILLILTSIAFFGCKELSQNKKETDAFPDLKGKYFDQEPPGFTPKLFAPDIISTGMSEINSVYSPDFNEFYYSVRTPKGHLCLVSLKYDGIKWSEPEVASFAGTYQSADPFITEDGMWLYYISKRPIDGSNEEKKDWDIWRVKNENGKWGESQRLDTMINSEQDEVYPIVTKKNRLYFSSGRKGAVHGRDLYYSQIEGNNFTKPKRLSDNINSNWEGDTYVSSNEDYLIVSSHGRPEGDGLYISFNDNGNWKDPIYMGKEINLHGGEWCPILSPDGKYFFFTSNFNKKIQSREKLTFSKIKESYKSPQAGSSDIYWVDARIIDKFRSEN